MNARTESWGKSNRDEGERRIRLIANTLATIAVVIVLCLTLFPFDFTASNFRLRFDKLLHPNIAIIEAEGLWDDVIVNVFLFVPLGYAFAVLIRRRSVEMLKPMLRVSAMGFLLSLTIEFLQVFLPFRFPSLFDVASNTIGAACGFALHRMLSGKISRSIATAFENDAIAIRWLVTTYGVGVLVLVGLVATLQYSLMFSYGNKSFPLTFGNEPTGARPWSGRIDYFVFAKETHEPSEVDAIFRTERLKFSSNSDTIVAWYDFRTAQPYVSRGFYRATLEHKGTTVVQSDTNGFLTNGDHWLESKYSGLIATTFVMHSSRLTILTRIASSGHQREPNARIMTIAGDPTKQNFSLVQTGDDLAIRLRTMVTGMNGTTPQFIAKDVFKDSSAHTIVVTYDREKIRVYVDNAHRVSEARLGPGFAFFSRLSPWNRNFYLSSLAARLYEPAFRVLIFIPFGVLFAIALAYRRRLVHDIMIVLALAIAPLAIEAMLAFQLSRSIDFEYVFFGIGVIAFTLVALSFARLTLRRRNKAVSHFSFSSTQVVHEHSS